MSYLARSLCFFLALLFGSAGAAAADDPVWIFFSDKGPSLGDRGALTTAWSRLTARAKKRRAKVLPADRLVDLSDLPVNAGYVQELMRRGVHIRAVSKWLNAVSVSGAAQQLEQIQALPFVVRRAPVLCLKRAPLPESNELLKPLAPSSEEYGPSLWQNAMIKVPDVHANNLHGEGVLIAVFDTGFRLNHAAFAALRVSAQYDFIQRDQNTNWETQDASSQIYHGTQVLSVLAGYSPGSLIGPAFASDFLLAKTEDTASEKPIEEDYWIAAAEWADSLGADIISTSVGYNDWYVYKNMDGNTAPITIAADLAVKKGILVVASAGNEGDTSWKHMLAPADGDSVLAVGAVHSDGRIATFSSRGPTADGRLKPDVVAPGVGIQCAAVPGGEEVGGAYTSISGTSAAAPLAAGVAALVLAAHPDLTPMQVREALIRTADRAADPDTLYGYGLLDAYAAVNYWGGPEPLPEKSQWVGCFPNPFTPRDHSRLEIVVDLAENSRVEIESYTMLGRRAALIWKGERSAGNNRRWYWDGTDGRGRVLPSGVYWLRIRINAVALTRKITLLN